MSIEEKLIESAKTALIDHSIESTDSIRPRLLTNDYKTGNKLLSTLIEELENCDSFSFSVAFITDSGIAGLKHTFSILEEKNISGRILTTDYLNFNEAKALRELLKFKNIDLRVYTGKFHTKGYIFNKQNIKTIIVGSSNITQDALCVNKEWNLKVNSLENGKLAEEISTDFENMWLESKPLTEEWIIGYESTCIQLKPIHTIQKIDSNKIVPNLMQIEALSALKETRQVGNKKALLISATGTGKTFLSAFDVKNVMPKRILFLAHREQILRQTLKSYETIIGRNISMGILSGNSKDYNSSFIFSTIQTMSKEFERFNKNDFDYIIIDEVHKAGSKSYQKVFSYFTPQFLLGMTATPERMDDFNIFEMFDYNVVYEIRLQKALEADLLCPFHYYGISDIIIDGKELDELSDFRYLITDERIDHIIKKLNFYGYSGERARGLVFCRLREEAKELSNKFNERGFSTICLTGENTQEERESAISRLKQRDYSGSLDYIFTVDLFNEGIDVPEINQIVMLRPTQSSIIFVQQLGRGLRKKEQKEYTIVIDFIGNYNNNFLIPIALSGDKTYDKDTLRRYLMNGGRTIPGASTINFDHISRKKIFDSINKTDFSGLRFLRKEYSDLKIKLGRVPTLTDFYKTGSIDPMLILEKYKTLYDFIKKGAKDPDYSVTLGDDENNLLSFISLLAPGKRPHETSILKMLIEKGEVSFDEIESHLFTKYNISNDKKSIKSSLRVLDGNFFLNSKKNSLISITENKILRSQTFEKYLRNKEFIKLVKDVLNYCSLEYNDNFSSRDGETNLSIFQKYSRKDVCRILNWSQDDSSTLYGYRIKHDTCPIFVTYEKGEEISSSTKYEEGFIDQSTFSWMTRNRLTLESLEVQKIINYKKTGLTFHLFVKKGDAEGRDFYYLGKVEPILEKISQQKIKDDKGFELPIVNVHYKLKTPVREDIYKYLLN